MNINHHWIDNNGTNIHFVEMNDKMKDKIPLVIIPGLSESAEDYISLIELLDPRHCVVMTLRGRGKSSLPKGGYTLEEHISDIHTVIKQLALKEFILMGYSRGVSYTIGYAIKNTNLLKGLIIGDYPAIHTQLRLGWADFYSSLPPWRGKPISQRMKREALIGLERDSSHVSFWDDLSSIHCPALIIRGGKQDAVLSLEAGKQYIEKLPQAKLVVFDESDHNIFEPDIQTFVNTVDLFMKNIK